MSKKQKPTALELATIAAWRAWGNAWAMHTACTGCGEFKPCRGRKRAKMICVDCWDQGAK